METLRGRVLILALVVGMSLLVQGCSLRLPTIPIVRKTAVTTVVKSKPLKIGGADSQQSTAITTDSFTSESNCKLDPTTGEKTPGGPEDSVLSYSQTNIEVPSNLTEALELDVEAIHFRAELPPEVLGAKPVVVSISGPAGDPVVLVCSVQNGQNQLELSAEDRRRLSQILGNETAIDLEIMADGALGQFTISDVQIQAAATFTANS